MVKSVDVAVQTEAGGGGRLPLDAVFDDSYRLLG